MKKYFGSASRNTDQRFDGLARKPCDSRNHFSAVKIFLHNRAAAAHLSYPPIFLSLTSSTVPFQPTRIKYLSCWCVVLDSGSFFLKWLSDSITPPFESTENRGRSDWFQEQQLFLRHFIIPSLTSKPLPYLPLEWICWRLTPARIYIRTTSILSFCWWKWIQRWDAVFNPEGYPPYAVCFLFFWS